MTLSGAITVVYALLLAVGGLVGGVSAGSRPSLIAGLASGAVALVAGGLLLAGQVAGLVLAGLVALGLLAFGGYHWLARRAKFLPRGLIACLSLAELLALLPAFSAVG